MKERNENVKVKLTLASFPDGQWKGRFVNSISDPPSNPCEPESASTRRNRPFRATSLDNGLQVGLFVPDESGAMGDTSAIGITSRRDVLPVPIEVIESDSVSE